MIAASKRRPRSRSTAVLALICAVLAGTFSAPGFSGAPRPLPVHEERGQDRRVAATELFSTIMSAESFVLGNGLQVVVIPDHQTSGVVHMVWYKVGAADDPPGKPGLAHLVEHLTFGGTQRYPGQEFYKALERVTTKQDAITARDYTVYYQRIAARQLPDIMQIEAERMSRVVISRESMMLEGKEVQEENDREAAGAHSVLDGRLQAALYGDHPYGKAASGNSSIAGLGLDDAAAFYRRWYTPDNAIVLVYGKVAPEQVRRLAHRYFGAIPAGNVPARRLAVDVKPIAMPSSIVVRDRQARNSIWMRYYLAPSYAAGDREHVYALQVLAELFGGGNESRLRQRLVLGNAIVREVDVEYKPDSVGPATFSVEIVVAGSARGAAVAEIVDRELRKLLIDGPGDAELALAKARLKSRPVHSEEDMPGVAQLVGGALAAGRTLGDVKAWPRWMDAVTAEQVRAAAAAVFDLDRGVTGTVLPAAEAG